MTRIVSRVIAVLRPDQLLVTNLAAGPAQPGGLSYAHSGGSFDGIDGEAPERDGHGLPNTYESGRLSCHASRNRDPSEPAVVSLMDADRWDWPDELDALTAAPVNHELMLENDSVRVLLTTIPVGAATAVHTHRWPSVEYILGATNFVRRDADGNALFDTRAANAEPHVGDVLWSDPFPPHSLENVGDAELRVIMVEIK